MVLQGMMTAIRKAVEKQCGGPRRLCLGEFNWPGSEDMPAGTGFNCLYMPNETPEGEHEPDLFETWEFANYIKQEIPDKDGWVLLDFYCYYHDSHPDRDHEHPGDLDTNVYVLVNATDRKVVEARGVGHSQYCEGFEEAMTAYNRPAVAAHP